MSAQPTGIELITAGREAVDDRIEHGDALAWAAACYAAPARIYREELLEGGAAFADPWPWPDAGVLAVDGRVDALVKAGALIAAEIDRRLQAAAA